MGRYSDSDDDKKKRKKKKKKRSRSRSRSESIESRHSTKSKKSKKTKKKYRSRSRSRSTDRYGRSRSYDRRRSRSRSRSYDRRSRSRDRYRRRSRSTSRGRYSRSRSRERRRRRSRSRSYERSSSRRSRSYSPSGKKDRKKRTSKEREDPCAHIPGFSEMTPTDQAKIRMQMALKAAAAADEKLKGEPAAGSVPAISFQDQFAFSTAVQDIESSGFTASSFKSNRWDGKKDDKENKDEFVFGTAGELRLDPSQRKPVIIDVDTEELAHPSFYTDPEEKMDKWIQKLTTMRRKRLEGEAFT